MKKLKSQAMSHIWDFVVELRIRKNRWLTDFESKKTMRIYDRHGFGKAFDYQCSATRRFKKRCTSINHAAAERDRYFLMRYD